MSTPATGTYHGPKPVTEEDQDLAEDHLKETQKVKQKVAELLKGKIKDHRDAAKERMNDKTLTPAERQKSKSYNDAHSDKHEDELDEIDKEQDKLHKSLKTLGVLRTHSRKTYNDVRNAKVKLMYRKSGVKDGDSK